MLLICHQISGLPFLDKKQANSLLRPNRKAKGSWALKPWEFQEPPWEQALEYAQSHDGPYTNYDLEKFEECTSAYEEMYETYDELMESGTKPTPEKPEYSCKCGSLYVSLDDWVVKAA